MFLRQLPVRAIIGSLPSLIRAFEDLIDTVAPVSAVDCILVEPLAAAHLGKLGIRAGTVARVGSALPVSAPDGSGLMFNEQEWRIDSADGYLSVSSLKARQTRFINSATSLAGIVASTTNGARMQLNPALCEAG